VACGACTDVLFGCACVLIHLTRTNLLPNLLATLICEKIKTLSISISDCRGQGYDNGSNMSGCYKGVQKQIIDLNKLAVYSPCGCHTLNLCGVAAAACCPDAITFLGVIQKYYNIFSSNPQRWEILLRNIKCSLHSTSDSRSNKKSLLGHYGPEKIKRSFYFGYRK
jgi:hypothetical protein